MLQIPLKLGLALNYLWYVNLMCTGVFCFTLSQIASFHSELSQNNKMERNYFHSPGCHHLYARKLLLTHFWTMFAANALRLISSAKITLHSCLDTGVDSVWISKATRNPEENCWIYLTEKWTHTLMISHV